MVKREPTERKLRADLSPTAPLVLADWYEERGRAEDAALCRLEARWRALLDRLAADPLTGLPAATLARMSRRDRHRHLLYEEGQEAGYRLICRVCGKEVDVRLRFVRDPARAFEGDRLGNWHMARHLLADSSKYRRDKAREIAEHHARALQK